MKRQRQADIARADDGDVRHRRVRRVDRRGSTGAATRWFLQGPPPD
jgi:hypothetical protein